MLFMWDEIMEQPAVLGRCIDKNAPALAEIVKLVKKNHIQSVVIAARGTSDHAAVYAKYAIEILTGIPVSLAAPSVRTIYNRALRFKNCLVMGISQSGKAEDVIEVIKAANAQGAATVGITNFEDSPLAAEAKVNLFCASGLERSVAATKTFTAQLYLLAHLAAEWSENTEMKKSLGVIPDKLHLVLANSQQVKEKAQRYRFMNECFVLARGINYSIALESALKIQETAYVRAKAYATSDFHHGPFAMIEPNMPVMVFAPDGPSLKDVEEMIEKLKKSSADLLVISNNREILRRGDCSIEIPPVDSGFLSHFYSDFVSPFYNVVTAQIFACNLAVIKGLNPDSPRGLNKVTITR